MKFDEAAEAMLNGKKIKRSCWSIWMSIDTPTSLTVNMCEMLADDWEVYEEPKKPRLLAPAFVKWEKSDHPELTAELYESEEIARKEVGKFFLSWPAVANAEGFYSVEGK
jgi:hypothetical protein